MVKEHARRDVWVDAHVGLVHENSTAEGQKGEVFTIVVVVHVHVVVGQLDDRGGDDKGRVGNLFKRDDSLVRVDGPGAEDEAHAGQLGHDGQVKRGAVEDDPAHTVVLPDLEHEDAHKEDAEKAHEKDDEVKQQADALERVVGLAVRVKRDRVLRRLCARGHAHEHFLAGNAAVEREGRRRAHDDPAVRRRAGRLRVDREVHDREFAGDACKLDRPRAGDDARPHVRERTTGHGGHEHRGHAVWQLV